MKTTKKAIQQIISNYIDVQNGYIIEHNKIIDILKPLEGKEINGRILNDKRLNGFKFIHEYGMFYLLGNYKHLIGYNSENIISIEKTEFSRGFKYFDGCHGRAATERINKVQNLDINQLTSVFSKIEKHFNSLRELFGTLNNENLDSFYNPIYYNLLDNIYKEENNNSLKLTDFNSIRI